MTYPTPRLIDADHMIGRLRAELTRQNAIVDDPATTAWERPRAALRAYNLETFIDELDAMADAANDPTNRELYPWRWVREAGK